MARSYCSEDLFSWLMKTHFLEANQTSENLEKPRVVLAPQNLNSDKVLKSGLKSPRRHKAESQSDKTLSEQNSGSFFSSLGEAFQNGWASVTDSDISDSSACDKSLDLIGLRTNLDPMEFVPQPQEQQPRPTK